MGTIAATIPRLLAQTPPSLRSSHRLSLLAASLRPYSISGNRRRLVRTAPPPIIAHRLLRVLSAAAATQDDSTTNTNNTGVSESVAEEEIKGEEVEKEVELSPVAAELKEMLRAKKEKDEKEGVGLFNGVAEEMAEIEWPAPGKVVGTTGVVLGVIAGSTAALLSVNALLAELSDRVFAGRGIQDFLSG